MSTHDPSDPGLTRRHSETGTSHPGQLVNQGGNTNPGLSPPGQLVDPAGHRTLAQKARDNWSTPWASDLGPGQLGELVDIAGPHTQARVTRGSL